MTPVVPPRPDLLEVLPPPPVGPPPIGPARRRRRSWGMIALALGALLTVVAIGLANLGPEHGPHAFLQVDSDGRPYRWDPCRPIEYVVNPERAPGGAIDDVHEAVARVSAATGIEFVGDGTVATDAQQQIGSAFMDSTTDTGYRPLLFTWESDFYLRTLDDRDNLLGFGIPWRGQGDLAHIYVSGAVVLNADAGMRTGFEGRYSEGAVLLHELGHVLGLAHVRRGADEIMATQRDVDYSVGNYGPGDLEGLAAVGREAGCLPGP
ncbi:MAG: hypothetical protein ACXWZU_10550 [Actinomycetota bacterium]